MDLSKRSFAGGEVSPDIYPKVDQTKYQTGLRTCFNSWVQKYGGVQNRPGTEFVGYSNFGVKQVPYQVSATLAYVLEFSIDGMRIITDGSYIEDTALTVSTITFSSGEVEVTTTAVHGLVDGYQVRISGTNVPKLDGRIVSVDVTSTTAFKLLLGDGTYLDGDDFSGATVTIGSIFKPVLIETDFSDLSIDRKFIKYSQSGDILTVVHPELPPQEIVRVSDTSWTIREALTTFPIGFPGVLQVSSGGAGSERNGYIVTAIDSDGRESEPSLAFAASTQVVTATTQAYPAVLTVTVDWRTLVYPGDIMWVASLPGMEELTTKYFKVLAVTATTVTIDIDTSDLGPQTSNGILVYTAATTTGSAPSVAAPWSLSWTPPTGAVEYKIYKKLGGHASPNAYGLIGVSNINAFQDQGYTPDTSDNPPLPSYYFNIGEVYPSVVFNFEQRQGFAATSAEPQKIFLSRTGDGIDFARRSSLNSDSPFNVNIRGSSGDYITNIIDIGKLVIFTSSSTRLLEGDDTGLTPLTAQVKRNSGEGSSFHDPQLISNSIFFVDSSSRDILKLDYSLDSISYEPSDTTLFSSHLFEGFTIVAWAYQRLPHSILWVVRSDGTLLGLTYIKSQEILAWHRHDIGGFVNDVVVVPEGNEDRVYFSVGRTITSDNGSSPQTYIERLSTRNDTAATSFKYMDSLRTYDGESAGLLGNMTLTGGTAWDETDASLTLTAASSIFNVEDVGNEVRLRDSAGTEIVFTIAAHSSNTVVTGTVNTSVPTGLRGVATTDWAKAVNTIAGLDHLEGQEVSVIADGYVISSPNNPAYETYSVANGEITLPRNYATIHIGLPYVSDVETLEIDSSQVETFANKKILVNEVTPHLQNTRGVFIGPKALDATSLQGLTEMKLREVANYSDVPGLTSGATRVTMAGNWDNGRVLFRQVDPVPMTISAVHVSGLFPTKGGR